MSIVTGNIVDWQGSPRPGMFPIVVFKPRKPAGQGANVFFTAPIEEVPAENGSFSVALLDSYSTDPLGLYDVEIQWRNATGIPVGFDQLTDEAHPLVVPVAGGELGTLLQYPANPSRAYYSLTPPPNPSPGTWWLEVNPDDPNDPGNTGFLYEWEN